VYRHGTLGRASSKCQTAKWVRESLYVPWSGHRPSIHFVTEPKDSFQPLFPLFPLFLRILKSLFRFGLFFDSWPILRQLHALQTFWLNQHPSSPRQPSAQQKFRTTLTPLRWTKPHSMPRCHVLRYLANGQAKTSLFPSMNP
jgi:hypothetical protein